MQAILPDVARSQHEPAGVDVVHAGHADRRVLEVHPGIHLGIEQDEGVGAGGEVADLAGRREGAALRDVDDAHEGEGVIGGAARRVGIDRIEGKQVTARTVESVTTSASCPASLVSLVDVQTKTSPPP
jgi:hypothetical protein